MNKIKYPYNVNQLTQQQAIEMLHKYYEIERWVKTLKEERGYLEEAFVELPWVLQVFPSNANFFLARVTDAVKFIIIWWERVLLYVIEIPYHCVATAFV